MRVDGDNSLSRIMHADSRVEGFISLLGDEDEADFLMDIKLPWESESSDRLTNMKQSKFLLTSSGGRS